MTVDLDALEALAHAATPGPWKRGHVKRDFVDGRYDIVGFGPESDEDAMIIAANPELPVIDGCGCCGSPSAKREDGEYIAAASPDVVLALIAHIRQLEAENIAQASQLLDPDATCCADASRVHREQREQIEALTKSNATKATRIAELLAAMVREPSTSEPLP